MASVQHKSRVDKKISLFSKVLYILKTYDRHIANFGHFVVSFDFGNPVWMKMWLRLVWTQRNIHQSFQHFSIDFSKARSTHQQIIIIIHIVSFWFFWEPATKMKSYSFFLHTHPITSTWKASYYCYLANLLKFVRGLILYVICRRLRYLIWNVLLMTRDLTFWRLWHILFKWVFAVSYRLSFAVYKNDFDFFKIQLLNEKIWIDKRILILQFPTFKCILGALQNMS